jgi:hypothetical protein
VHHGQQKHTEANSDSLHSSVVPGHIAEPRHHAPKPLAPPPLLGLLLPPAAASWEPAACRWSLMYFSISLCLQLISSLF